MTAPLPLRREDWSEALTEDWAERAAILEFCNGLDRRTAEREAALIIRRRYARWGK